MIKFYARDCQIIPCWIRFKLTNFSLITKRLRISSDSPLSFQIQGKYLHMADDIAVASKIQEG